MTLRDDELPCAGPPDDEDAPLEGERANVDQGRVFLFLLLLLAVGSALVFAIVLPSWRPRHNMLSQPYYRPDEPSELFADQTSQRPLPSGVVPRPADQSPGVPYVAVRQPGPALFPMLAPDQKIPVAVTPEVLNRGQELFGVFCSVCHGAGGNGDGMIVQRGMYPPPSYHIERLRTAPDSHFYNVITNGYGTMFSYSDRVAPADRWAIVAYIRALQLAVEKHPDLSRQLQKPAGVRP